MKLTDDGVHIVGSEKLKGVLGELLDTDPTDVTAFTNWSRGYALAFQHGLVTRTTFWHPTLSQAVAEAHNKIKEEVHG